MAVPYLLYSLCFFSIFVATILYATRTYWHIYLPPTLANLQLPLPFFRHRYAPLHRDSTFSDDAAAGLHSGTFDLSGNIESGDSRAGLDAQGKREVLRVMKSRAVNFDEARRIVVMEKFRTAGIGEDGRPKDPKFVSFS